ncbi:MAG: phenylalanyl-tRNA synthetase beta chain [Pseudohongiellaceae bacterium]|jgi:phenylalanyl-tRNA synthetase beta chain
MYLSLNWLGDHVDLSGLEPERIAHDLTMRTALIEGFVDQRKVLADVVVGEVLTCGPHPDADRLSLCTVEWGADEPAQVVCGAPNVRAGQKVFYAPVKTVLPNGMKLKKAKIRGIASAGMICAEDELGLGAEHDGILELDPGLVAGTPCADVPGLLDVIFDIDNKSVTHRPDLWGHRGFARELAAIYGRELKPLSLMGGLRSGAEAPNVSVETGAGCSLYAGLSIEARPGRSPDWMRFRLVACGMRPINLLVDLSNYVMLELGQPTHPFDRDRLVDDRIEVRRALQSEKMVTLDNVERELCTADLVIADGGRAVAIAGVMGSACAEVGEDTLRVLLESASFDATTVRQTSSRLGLRTDALARFEKCLDPALVEQALARYSWWLTQLDPEAKVDEHYVISGVAQSPSLIISLKSDMVRSRLGLAVSDSEIASTLSSVGFGVTAAEALGELIVEVPSWRATRDVSLPEDLVEEVGRLVGYDRIETPAPRGPLILGERDPRLVVEEELRDAFSRRLGFTEVFNYSTLADKVFEQMGQGVDESRPRLTNALQQDAARLRPAVAPSLLGLLPTWLRQEAAPRCFEVGRGFDLNDEGESLERRQVVALAGRRDRGDTRDLVRLLRGSLDVALEALGAAEAVYSQGESLNDEPWFHEHQLAVARVGDVEVARLGVVAPEVLQRLDVAGAAAILVFDVDALVACERRSSRYQALHRQPAALFDLAFVATYDLSSDDLAEAIAKAGPKTLREVKAFDVYRGKGLAENERSIAFHLVFQARDRTLTEKDLGKARDRIVNAVEKLGARLR